MSTPNVHCTILEIECDHAMPSHESPTVRELLPWADPFIAQLVDRYRLRAALADSLQFLRTESGHPLPEPVGDHSRLRPKNRFTLPDDISNLPGEG